MVTVLSGHFSFQRSPINFLSSALVHTSVSETTYSTEDFRSALGHQQAVSVVELHMSAVHSIQVPQAPLVPLVNVFRLCVRACAGDLIDITAISQQFLLFGTHRRQLNSKTQSRSFDFLHHSMLSLKRRQWYQRGGCCGS